MAKASKQADTQDNAPAGHNATPPEDAFTATNLAKMVAADILLDEAKSDHKAIRAHVEAKGINVKAHALSSKIIASGKVDDYVRLFSDTLKYLKIRGRPVQSSQLELLPTEDDATPLDDRAYEDGRYAAFFCRGDDANPYDPTSKVGQRWIAGLRQGQTEYDLVMSMAPEGNELIKAGEADGDEPFPDAEAA